VYSCDNLRRTPLHYDCMCDRSVKHIDEFTDIFINRVDVELIINKQDIFGRTALHYAAIADNRKFIDAAIDYDQVLMDLLETMKADRKIKDKFGKTANDYVSMRDAFYYNVSLKSLTAISFADSCCPPIIPVCVKRCFEERSGDSLQYEAELREMTQDF